MGSYDSEGVWHSEMEDFNNYHHIDWRSPDEKEYNTFKPSDKGGGGGPGINMGDLWDALLASSNSTHTPDFSQFDFMQFGGDDKSKANVYIETDGVGHVYLEIDGTVYSYGRYNGSYSPPLGSLGPYGDGILLKLDGNNAANFIKERNEKYPTSKFSVEVNGTQVKAYYGKLYNSGTPLEGKKGYYKYGRAVDVYSLVGPGGNNCTTITYKALNSGGARVKPAQTPAGMLYDFQQIEYVKRGYNPGRHIWGPK
ncbi:hypothetical protein CHRYSEOSP005_30100 [Chryseobacterium sp. Alg-005]|uniref:hypothetical protein n=1 Tax=Chryseobacterium sp. Alg-005 TaxID=3159516 RepID=UPI00355572B2